jgi:hypothetical protein
MDTALFGLARQAEVRMSRRHVYELNAEHKLHIYCDSNLMIFAESK